VVFFNVFPQDNYEYLNGLESFSDWEEGVSQKKYDWISLSPDRVTYVL